MKVRAYSNTANYAPVRVVKPCRQCHEWFIGTPKGVYCSKECCDKYLAKHRKPRDRSKDKPRIKPERGPFTCRYCRKDYMTRLSKGEGEKYCSRDCAFADLHLNAVTHKYSTVHFARCRNCNSSFVGKNINQHCCSDNCKIEDKKNRSNKYSQQRNIDRHKKEGRTHKCVICHTTYCLIYGAKQMKYCCSECFKQSDTYKKERRSNSSRNAARRRRQRLNRKGQYFDPFDIFDRDQWRCQACGIKTPKRLRGSYEDNAPELDHIVPLSLGGTHTRTNVRCCCRKCNGMKGNRSLNDQLMLVG